MPDVIFAKPRWDYKSYTDYWRLVELAGYPLIYIDEIDPQSDNVYIFSQPPTDWHHGWPDAKARIIYYSLEWYLDVDYRSIPGVECWSPDAWYAERTGMRYVPMGGDARLNPEPNYKFEPVHVATLWAPSGNRYTPMGSMVEAGVTIAPNAWDDDRHKVLQAAYAMIHAHQWADVPTIAPQRFALAAAYHLPLISETLGNAGVFDNAVMQTTGKDMGRFIVDARQQSTPLRKAADRLYKLMCEELTFKKGIEAAL